jgi:hypothetical protein
VKYTNHDSLGFQTSPGMPTSMGLDFDVNLAGLPSVDTGEGSRRILPVPGADRQNEPYDPDLSYDDECEYECDRDFEEEWNDRAGHADVDSSFFMTGVEGAE